MSIRGSSTSDKSPDTTSGWKISQILFVLALWTLVRFVPYFLVDDFIFDFSFHHQYKGGLPLVLLALGTPALLFFESLWWVVLCTVVVRLRGVAKFVSGSILFALLYAYQLFLLCSWIAFARTGFFLGIDSLSLLEYVAQASDVLVATSANDLHALLVAGLLALLPLVLYLTIAQRSGSALLRPVRLLCIFLFFMAAIWLPPQLLERLPTKRQKLLESLAYNFMAPELSSVWAPVWFGWPVPDFTVVPLSLKPQYSLDEYLEQNRVPVTPKNFIVLMIEALRADVLQSYGGTRSVMPFLDALAKKSIVYRRAYSQAPETGYSQTTILTGMYPLKFPMRDVGRDLGYPVLRIYDLLAELGYRTGYFTEEWGPTVRQNRSDSLDKYFKPLALDRSEIESFLPPGTASFDRLGFPTFATIDRVNIRAMTDWITKDKSDTPFFAASYLYASHYPFDLPDEEFRIFNPSSLQNKDISRVSFLGYPEEFSEIMHNRYLNCLRFIDAQLRQMFSELERAGKLENTVVIITADHGELFHEHGFVNHAGYMYEEVMHVPLLLYGLDPESHGAVDRLVGHVDIAPTIVDVLGLSPHDNMQGTSLLKENQSEENERPLFATVQFAIQEDCVWQSRWKYCFNLREQKARLFDISTDPGETQNLVATRPEIAIALQETLNEFRNRQLTYYSPDQAYRDSYFPPKDYYNSGNLSGLD